MAILLQSGLLTRRKLSLMGDYIGRGQTVTPATMIQGIVLFLKMPNTQGPTVLPNCSTYLSTGSYARGFEALRKRTH
jgi:hypothetical protein